MTVTVNTEELEAKVKDMYRDVAERPEGRFHFELRMSRVPWNFGGGPMIIRLRSWSHRDMWVGQCLSLIHISEPTRPY